MKTYSIPIVFRLKVDGNSLPEELPEVLIKSLIDNLNISDETNGMFMDSLQERISGDIVSFDFEYKEKL